MDIHLMRRLRIINEPESVRLLKKQDFDIFHPTYYNPYFMKQLQGKPYVLTVYDMIHEIFSDMLKWDHAVADKKRVIECATKIVAISNNTKADIIKFYDCDPKKIEVIPLAASLHNNTPNISLNLPQRYILFIGDRGFYKNFTFFINSISSLLNDEHDLYLICAGGKVFSYTEIHLFDVLKIKKKIIRYPIINDMMLSQLYRKAILFIFPSLYEGFGIPLLEAFSCGCPVAASNTSSLPEVGGDAVNYFDPYDSDSIRKVIEDILYDNSLQDSMRVKGYQRQKCFSWEMTAMQTKKVYEDILT
jgi:glycosyltransferase involved in cell wall biosynthesis